MTSGLKIQQKRSFHVVSVVLWGLLILGLVASGWFLYRYFMYGDTPPGISAQAISGRNIDETPVTPKQIDAHTVPADQPRYISIPTLGIKNARIFGVGVTKDNQLDAPKNIFDVAWYKKSALPGSGQGAVLLDAHNGGVTKDGIFARLKELKQGDTLTIERGDGKEITYRVKENVSMPLEEVNSTGMKNMMVSADSTKEGLNVITCDGKYVPRFKEYDRRIMLRAVAE